ncbi:hypothetical protein QJS10_CPB15g01667 [Acorus calamus]|uniref:YABBY protein C-terminal domain-containing protein n=1 Tax=Acorus calamus TaxID=4465 RepID=A0AAV9D6K4_ACOCL|nr:hypothetical protein QJS10_CPB15g01667 [Acorus calamus]
MSKVQVPNGKFFGTHLVRCGHCLGDFDIMIPGPHVDSQSSDYQSGIQIQSLCSKHNTLPSFASSSTSSQLTTATTHHVVKPPEKKHRLPSAYNRFMNINFSTNNDKNASTGRRFNESKRPNPISLIVKHLAWLRRTGQDVLLVHNLRRSLIARALILQSLQLVTMREFMDLSWELIIDVVLDLNKQMKELLHGTTNLKNM